MHLASLAATLKPCLRACHVLTCGRSRGIRPRGRRRRADAVRQQVRNAVGAVKRGLDGQCLPPAAKSAIVRDTAVWSGHPLHDGIHALALSQRQSEQHFDFRAVRLAG